MPAILASVLFRDDREWEGRLAFANWSRNKFLDCLVRTVSAALTAAVGTIRQACKYPKTRNNPGDATVK